MAAGCVPFLNDRKRPRLCENAVQCSRGMIGVTCGERAMKRFVKGECIVIAAEAFNGLTDADLGRIIAFLKSFPLASGFGPTISVGPLGRLGIATGKFRPVASIPKPCGGSTVRPLRDRLRCKLRRDRAPTY